MMLKVDLARSIQRLDLDPQTQIHAGPINSIVAILKIRSRDKIVAEEFGNNVTDQRGFNIN